MGSGKIDAQIKTKEQLGKLISAYNIGIEISDVKIQEAYPPAQVKESFDKVCGIIKKLNSTDTFSMNRVREEMGRASATKVKTFLEEWQDFAMGKKAQKTRDQYLQSCNSFYKSLGCHLARIKVCLLYTSPSPRDS